MYKFFVYVDIRFVNLLNNENLIKNYLSRENVFFFFFRMIRNNNNNDDNDYNSNNNVDWYRV